MRESPSLASLATPAMLQEFLGRQGENSSPCGLLRSLVEAGYGNLPRPGSGRTLKRWQMLAAVAQFDLSLAKLYESHADALAILHELGSGEPAADAAATWAVWCAEPPDRRVRIHADDEGDRDGDGAVRLHGTKAWCSGAGHLDRALVSAWNDQEQPCLVAVDLAQPGIRIAPGTWPAIGMAATASTDIVFDDARGRLVGAPHAYLDRPGFHHGAGGIAACWHGAASAIAAEVLRTARRRRDDAHVLAHLGLIDTALVQARHQLRIAAAEIDAKPQQSCQHAVRRARLAAESAAETVLIRGPRAFGPEPMCKDARLSRLLADLPVFIRQSHAERDLAVHGAAVAEQATEIPWTL